MAGYYDYCSEGMGYEAGNGLRSAAYGRSGYPGASASTTAAEFNPRAINSGTGGTRAEGYWPALPAEAAFDHSTAGVPRWWVPPAVASPTTSTTSYGASYPPSASFAVEPVGCASNPNMGAAGRHVEDAPPNRIDRPPADLHADSVSNNPYLITSDVPNKSASTWRQLQLEDWSEAGLSSGQAYLPQSATSRTQAATEHGERGVLPPIFPDQQPHASASYSASAIHSLPQFAVLNRPRASPLRPTYTTMHGDGTRPRALEDELHFCGTDQGRSSVGKSQSMRALYEENAALRRALHSIRRGSANNFDSTLALESDQGLREPDRCIASDVAEGRALSMRERGRWSMQATGDGSYPVWVGTPRRQWAAGAPLQSVQAGAVADHRRPRYHYQNQWWDHDITTEHPLFYGGGSFSGWPESEPMCWSDIHNESRSGAAHDEGRISDHQGTSLRQLLGGGSQKWRREGKKKVARRREVAKRQGEQVQGGQCAMCGGRLRHVEGGKSRVAGGLPLRLCPACHPHATASLPLSTRSPPALPPSHSHRHHVATAVFMACRPTAADDEDIDPARLYPSSKPLKVRSGTGSRSILDLCRHFVGLSTKSPPPSN